MQFRSCVPEGLLVVRASCVRTKQQSSRQGKRCLRNVIIKKAKEATKRLLSACCDTMTTPARPPFFRFQPRVRSTTYTHTHTPSYSLFPSVSKRYKCVCMYLRKYVADGHDIPSCSPNCPPISFPQSSPFPHNARLRRRSKVSSDSSNSPNLHFEAQCQVVNQKSRLTARNDEQSCPVNFQTFQISQPLTLHVAVKCTHYAIIQYSWLLYIERRSKYQSLSTAKTALITL